MRGVAAAAVLTVLLVGCSAEKPAQVAAGPTSSPITVPIPSTVGGTVPIPTNTLSTAKPTDAAVPPELPEEATAPPPASSGPLSARNLPPADKLGAGWTTYVDPGGAEKGFLGNQTWTRRRDAHQAAFEALPFGCAGQLPTGSLPVPQYALQGSYRTAAAKPATVLLLRFSDSSKATTYYTGYQDRMKACGNGGELSVRPLWSSATAAGAVRLYAGPEPEAYVEATVLHSSTVALLAASSTTPDTAPTWTRTVIPALQTAIDSP